MSTSCDHNYWLTVTLAVAVWPPYDALIEVLPMETALQNPAELTVATVGTLDDQPAWLVTVLNEPSEKFAWFSLEPFREFPFCQILRTPHRAMRRASQTSRRRGAMIRVWAAASVVSPREAA